MCIPDDDGSPKTHGTLLRIVKFEQLPDGRSLVETVGDRRFKIIEKGMRDGYHVAKVEWVAEEKEDETDSLRTEAGQTFKTDFVRVCHDMYETLPIRAHCDSPPDTFTTAFYWLLDVLPLNGEFKYELMFGTEGFHSRCRRVREVAELVLERFRQRGR